MNTALSRTTSFSFGHSNQKDSFQRGREAAQMAKAGMPAPHSDLILALGPTSSSFQDFIEGVRLVTGEAGLVGFPSQNIFTNDIYMADGGFVILVKSDSMKFSIGSSSLEDSRINAALTSLLSQHRSQRGNAFSEFAHRGMMVFDNVGGPDKKMIEYLSVETGLNSWALSVCPNIHPPLPLIANDNIINKGLVGIECLSSKSVGIGTVTLQAFDRKAAIIGEAVKSAIREAQSQMDGHPPVAGLLFFDFLIESKVVQDMQAMFHNPDFPKGLPLVGLTSERNSIKHLHRAGSVLKETVVAVLFPL